MATLVLSAAGAALGGSLGGSFVGLSSMALGKAAGAMLGNSIDQLVLGQGAAPVESGQVDKFRVMGANEGSPLERVFGRTRVAGHLIWSSRFFETVNEENVGGKGGGGTLREYSYSISIAIALCEGEVVRVGRIWADGQVVDQSDLNWRLHRGTEDQIPDPLISAIEGSDVTPAYRGTAYVVIENLELAPYGNRIPQFSFEVFRRPDADENKAGRSPAKDIQGVALVPGTGEYALATEPVYYQRGRGESVVLNVHNDRGIPDLNASLDQLALELPEARSVSLVVSWFGDDLRCSHCTLRPAVEQDEEDGYPIAWRVSGQDRMSANKVSRVDGRPVFGGTPSDQTVVQAITKMNSTGNRVMFYPFILMDIPAGNALPDPWSSVGSQPVIPWRGRITLSAAPGQSGSPDKTPMAADEVAGFFGDVVPGDFETESGNVVYTGPDEWSYRRMVLHYARLCAVAGGVDAFCIGSELRGLTCIRDGAASYPVVRELCRLTEDVRVILGADTKIGYAADWSEYFGHHPSDGSGDVNFHLDPLWSHPEIDFVGIDNYMPLSDWRDEDDHADASAGTVYSLDYLKSNIAGGEGYEWYYSDSAAREAQDRTPIVDTAYGEDWVFRGKDLVSWWSKQHYNRSGGVRASAHTGWVPKSKPIWFTELGCPAVDKGTNQPNVFHDPKSSESFLPYYSSGAKDEYIQYRYLQAMYEHWGDPANNPVSGVYSDKMVDMSHAFVWAWDARPWPDFPNRIDTWVDGRNHHLGHWLNGRTTLASLSEVVTEICGWHGVEDLDLSGLHGVLTGYSISDVETARQSLQPLMLSYSFDSYALDGQVIFSSRSGAVSKTFNEVHFAVSDSAPVVSLSRSPASETIGRVTLGYANGNNDYVVGAAEALASDLAEPNVSQSSVPVVLSAGDAKAIAERWLVEGRVARDSLTFALPPSSIALVPGDVVRVFTKGQNDTFRIDRVDEQGTRTVNAVRVERGLYVAPSNEMDMPQAKRVSGVVPPYSVFMDLPLLSCDEVEHAPHIAVTSRPWQGGAAVYSAPDDQGYSLNRKVSRPATIGTTLDEIASGVPGLWANQAFRVRIGSGLLQSRPPHDILNGANVAALRYGSEGDWEIIQFRDAELIAPNEYRLSRILRGQAGTDGIIPDVWPSGAEFVLLDGAVDQIDLPRSARGVEQHYRIGPASKPYDAPSYSHHVASFEGVGLRPYQPAHLMVFREPGGDIRLNWIRRTRIDGDSWQGHDVPLGEARELYHVRVIRNQNVVREFSPEAATLLYTAQEQSVDGAIGDLIFEVAQVSERFGAGPYKRTVLND